MGDGPVFVRVCACVCGGCAGYAVQIDGFERLKNIRSANVSRIPNFSFGSSTPVRLGSGSGRGGTTGDGDGIFVFGRSPAPAPAPALGATCGTEATQTPEALESEDDEDTDL